MKLFVAAKAVVTRSDGRVLIVRESGSYDEGTNEGKWDVVGGRIDPEESLFEGLKREVAEESGLEVEIGKTITVHEKFQEIKGEQVHIIRIYFQCTTAQDEVVLSEDHDKYEWIGLSDVEDYSIMEDVKEVLRMV